MNIRKIYLPYSLAETHLSKGLSQPMLGQIQCLLKKKGFYRGVEQTIYTEEIGEAIFQFQKSEKLLPTGRIDPITYCRLYGTDVMEITPVKDNRHRADMTLVRGRILIHKPTRQLTLFNGKNQLRSYPVAIGKPSTPTPEGDFAIATKIMNPGGILGTRWMGLNFDPNYGIHGNRAPWSIGQLVSLGCVRMHNHHVEELFAMVRVGTPVMIR
ncbi:L,D-transpeptidase family protein [Pelosinus propionicus]|uniref:Putative peptidoglycan binding domain-containing protein n=1 Tax=Pelosinus propionicus DSM 13327 TaxID=1123291 RepID=A0A1I4GX02_9FIRM|nr:L,D-transpeptidase family protein [Pelosinus propionicus]SFL34534.1 Putative peptidoglycan binding domain-containing protein [Pelosinus propionicus DSM 13327]